MSKIRKKSVVNATKNVEKRETLIHFDNSTYSEENFDDLPSSNEKNDDILTSEEENFDNSTVDNYEENSDNSTTEICHPNIVAICQTKPEIVTVTEQRQNCSRKRNGEDQLLTTKICITYKDGSWYCKNLVIKSLIIN